MHKLKEKAFSGIFWNGARFVFGQTSLLVVRIFLARILLPEEFGLAAMAYILISSLGFIKSIGTGAAFVRDHESDQKKAKNTLFWMNTTAILLVAIFAFLLAPYVTQFFAKKISDPQSVNTLLWMFRLVAVQQLFGIITIVPNGLLAKELKFKQGVIAGMCGTIVFLITAIVLGAYGFGAWAIVISHLLQGVVSSLIIFSCAPFIPGFIFDVKIAKKYLHFGKNKFINSIMGIFIHNTDNSLVGRMVGVAALGFYGLAEHFLGIVTTVTSGILGSVMFPIFSKIQKNKTLYRKTFLKVYRLKLLFVIPGIAGAVILAQDIIMIVFGEKWLPLVPIFYALAISTLIGHLVAMAGPVFDSLNKPHIMRNVKLIQLPFYGILIYPFTKLWGTVGVAMVFIVFSIIGVFYIAPRLAKEIPGLYKYSFKLLIKIIPCTLMMMGVVYIVRKNILVDTPFSLFGMVLLGAIVYMIPILFLDKDLKWDIREGLRILRQGIKI